MGPDVQDVLGRFHRVLVREVLSRSPGTLTAPLTVGDIYYDLVPFETRQKELGIESVLDYEHALLQLLAGQGGYVKLEYIADRQRIQRHANSLYPSPGLYREFLSSGIRISPIAEAQPPVEEKEEDLRHFENCPSCSEEIPQRASAKFCAFCGTNLQRVLCPSCGEKLLLEWRFCISCGTRVESEKAH